MNTAKDTYEMYYKCWNCFRIFSKALPKGTPAERNGGECQYCGMKDDVVLEFKDKLCTHTPIEND